MNNPDWDKLPSNFQQSVLRSLAHQKASPSTAMLRTADQSEPILYEKDGWGIFGNSEDGGNGKQNGHTLTHIGCDCEFPNWSMSRYIWDMPYADGFTCEECQVKLSLESYKEFCKVYNLINDINFNSENWEI